MLVSEQRQMIDDIEANIVSTAVRTKDARRELTKADKSQKAARNKMICLAVSSLSCSSCSYSSCCSELS